MVLDKGGNILLTHLAILYPLRGSGGCDAISISLCIYILDRVRQSLPLRWITPCLWSFTARYLQMEEQMKYSVGSSSHLKVQLQETKRRV